MSELQAGSTATSRNAADSEFASTQAQAQGELITSTSTPSPTPGLLIDFSCHQCGETLRQARAYCHVCLHDLVRHMRGSCVECGKKLVLPICHECIKRERVDIILALKDQVRTLQEKLNAFRRIP